MYRLQVWYDRHWKWGVNSYDSEEEAEKRVNELSRVGIKARIKPETELFN